MNTIDNPKSLIYALLAIILAILIVSFSKNFSKLQKLTNLNLSIMGISDLYVQMVPASPGKCYVTNRRGSTFRRSDDPAARQTWSYKKSSGDNDSGNLNHWMLQSTARKIFLLIPVNDIKDWAYPYIYQFVQGIEYEVELPSVKWVQLHVNRIYHGLYLQVYLPHDLRRRDGGSGYLREFLILQDSTITCLTTRFSNPCSSYRTMIANSRFPTLMPSPKLVKWLIMHFPIAETLLVMQPYEPYQISHLSLPISLAEEYSKINGKPLPNWVDDRFVTFHLANAANSSKLKNILSGKKIQRIRKEWGKYKSDFTNALKIHCDYHQCGNEMTLEFPKRLESSWERIENELEDISS